ncbi:helix-turn-helix domain-containing protein [Sphaerisporangium sp. NPDC005289]|uniref:nSTAND1 domain-containing NTPase n=1 Tax=Sphaerisporangium sp. NPDC005289 TaxID=3155247 RepID=UPI0033A6A9AA
MADADDPEPERIQSRRDFARELTRLRERAGLTVRQVAAKAGAQSAHSTIGDWFAGRGLPSTASRDLLAEVVRVCGDTRAEQWLAAWRRVRQTPGPRRAEREPYRGLAAFQPRDADWFFGRADLTARLVARVAELRERGGGILVLVGPSGSGKSSLLGAGLVAACGTGVIRTPGARPMDAVEGLTGPLIVLDQFEELFTLCQDEAERRRFVTAVQDLARGNVVVLGLRADFYTQALGHPELVAAIADGQIAVGPMDEAGLRAAIAEPAGKAGLDLEPGLVELILRDLAPGAGVLPLLSHALYATWRHSQGRTLTVADYRAAGGIGGAVALSADTAYAELTEPQRALARRLLLHLVRVAQDTADTRRRVHRDQLPEDAEDVLRRFIAQRLLTADHETVEISHEALLTAWPLLRSWLNEDRAGLLLGRRLAEDAEAWHAESRDPAALYRGARLAAAREWSANAGPHSSPGALATEFLDASTALEHRQTLAARAGARRMRRLAAALVVLLVLACGSGIAALRAAATAREQRDIALSREVAQEAAAIRDSDPALAAQLTLAAYTFAPTTEARGGLLSAFSVPFAVRLTGHTEYVNDVEYAPGGRLLASAGDDRTVRLWDLSDPRRPRPKATLTGHTDSVNVLAFAPDGRTLASAGSDGVIRLWDVATARPAAALPARDGPVYALAFTPDGRSVVSAGPAGDVRLRETATGRTLATLRGHHGAIAFLAVHGRLLASAGADGTARLWDLAARRPLATLTGHTGGVRAVGFSPDGRRLVTAGEDGTPRLWDISHPAHPRPYAELSGHAGTVLRAVYAPDGRTLATAGADNTARVWSADDGRQLELFSPRLGVAIDTSTISDVAFSPDGRTLATGSYDHLLRLWDVPGSALPAAGRSRPIWSAPDGRTMITADGRHVWRWNLGDPHHPVGRVLADTEGLAMLSADGSLMVTAGPRRSVRLWDLTGPAPRRLADLKGLPTAPDSAEFSADRRLLAVTATRDYVIRVWDLRDPGRPRRTTPLTGHTGFVNAIAFDPARPLLASFGYDRTARLWDLTDPARPVLAAVLRGHDNAVFNGAFSPDGRTLATTSQDTTVRLWDLTDPRRPAALATLRGHGSFVDSVAFSGDGRLLATGGGDPAVHLWDLTDRRAPTRWAVLTGGDGPVVGLLFAGRLLAGGGAGRATLLWNVDPDAAAASVCARAYPALTPAQWKDHFPGIDPRPQCPHHPAP